MLDHFDDWCEKWQLMINPSKCLSMNFSHSNPLKYYPKYTDKVNPINNKMSRISKYTINSIPLKYEATARYHTGQELPSHNVLSWFYASNNFYILRYSSYCRVYQTVYFELFPIFCACIDLEI